MNSKTFVGLPTISVPLKKPNNPQIKAYQRAVENGLKSQYIIPNKNKWIVKKLTSPKSIQQFSSQKEAVDYAKREAESGTAIFVHNHEGVIIQKYYK